MEIETCSMGYSNCDMLCSIDHDAVNNYYTKKICMNVSLYLICMFIDGF